MRPVEGRDSVGLGPRSGCDLPGLQITSTTRRYRALPIAAKWENHVTSLPSFSEAELEDARLAYLKNCNYRTMNCGRGSAEIITVVGASRFQEKFRRVAEAPRPTLQV